LDVKGERVVVAGGDKTGEKEFGPEGCDVKNSFSVTRDETGMIVIEDFDIDFDFDFDIYIDIDFDMDFDIEDIVFQVDGSFNITEDGKASLEGAASEFREFAISHASTGLKFGRLTKEREKQVQFVKVSAKQGSAFREQQLVGGRTAAGRQ
jgi:hypothetical protein